MFTRFRPRIRARMRAHPPTNAPTHTGRFAPEYGTRAPVVRPRSAVDCVTFARFRHNRVTSPDACLLTLLRLHGGASFARRMACAVHMSRRQKARA